MAWVKIEKQLTAQFQSGVTPVEMMVFCPSCKAFQIARYAGGVLNNERKFVKSGNYIYHDCGSEEACALFISV